MKDGFAGFHGATLSLSLSLFAMTLGSSARAHTCPVTTCVPVPADFTGTGFSVFAGVGGAGDVTANLFAGNSSTAGSIFFYPASGSNYLSIQAPSSMSSTVSWTLPSGAPPSNSFLLFPAGGSNLLAYTTFGATGNVTPTFSSGMVNFSLSNTPNFLGGATFEVGSNAILQLASGGGQSSVTITSAGSGGSPTLSVSTTAVTGVPLTLEDSNGGGINLVSNGQTAFSATNPTTTGTDYIQAAGVQSGGTTTPSPSLSAEGPTDPNINLILSAKGTGAVAVASNLDLLANAITTNLPVDSGCGTAAANAPAFMKTGGTALSVHTLSAGTGCTGVSGQTHGYLGISVFARTTGQAAVVATGGQFPCTFDSPPSTAGDYVAVSLGMGSAGLCHDTAILASAAPPAPMSGVYGQVIGILVSTTAVSMSSYLVLIKPAF